MAIRLARGETATVTIPPHHGDEVHQVRKAGNGRIVWKKLKSTSPDDAA